MTLGVSLLRRAKPENLRRLARAMGIGTADVMPLGMLYGAIAARAVGLRLQDEWARLREREAKNVR